MYEFDPNPDEYNKMLDEIKILKKELSIAVSYLKEAKLKFYPHTTNSFVDDFIKKHEKQEVTAEDSRKDAYIAMLEEIVKELNQTIEFYSRDITHPKGAAVRINYTTNAFTSDDYDETHFIGKRARECQTLCAQIRARFDAGGEKL